MSGQPPDPRLSSFPNFPSRSSVPRPHSVPLAAPRAPDPVTSNACLQAETLRVSLRNSQKRKPLNEGHECGRGHAAGVGGGGWPAIVRPPVRVSEDTHEGKGAPAGVPRLPSPVGTHTLPHPRPREKVIEVFFFPSEEKAPSIERMYSGTWENSCARSPPDYPQVAVLHGAPTFLPARPLSPQARPSAERLLLKPLPKLLFTAQRGAAKVVGRPPAPPPPGPRGGRLKTLPSGFFFLSPKKSESN